MNERKTRHATYNINYHFVWCPKYRKPVLVGEVKEMVERCFREKAEQHGWEILNLSIQPDHVHLFLSARPIFAPTFIVKAMKGYSAKQVMKEHRFAKRFWSPGYYVGTAGSVTEKTVQRYIDEQGKK